MTSSSLHLFAVAEDIKNWLVLLGEKYVLDAILFSLGEDHAAVIVTPSASTVLPENVFRVFLFPRQKMQVKLRIGDIKCIEWGWIDVRPGRLVVIDGRNVLTETQIYGSDADAKFKAAAALTWLKRKIKPTLKFGVTGLDPKTKRSSVYKTLGYTNQALEVINSGGQWRTGEKHTAFFAPLK